MLFSSLAVSDCMNSLPLKGSTRPKVSAEPPCPPANPSIGSTFIILTFPFRQRDIKVDPGLVPL